MLGRHFEHVLWSDEFYNAMGGADYIFILQKPTNMIGHLGILYTFSIFEKKWKQFLKKMNSKRIFFNCKNTKDAIDNIINNDHVDMLITNVKKKALFHGTHCESVTSVNLDHDMAHVQNSEGTKSLEIVWLILYESYSMNHTLWVILYESYCMTITKINLR